MDFWNDDWSVEKKHSVISISIDAHRHKGTMHAVRTALNAINTDIEITEWFDQNPLSDPNTMQVTILAKEGLSDSVVDEVKAILDTTKPLHVHYGISFKQLSSVLMNLASAGVIRLRKSIQVASKLSHQFQNNLNIYHTGTGRQRINVTGTIQ